MTDCLCGASSVWDVYEYVFGIGGTTTTRYYLCSVNDRVGDVPKIFPGAELSGGAGRGISWNSSGCMNESYCTESERTRPRHNTSACWQSLSHCDNTVVDCAIAPATPEYLQVVLMTMMMALGHPSPQVIS